jgi:GNAT superfamily N-acetyltransferase
MDVTITKARPDDGPELLQLLRTSGLPLDGVLDHLPTALVARSEARIVGSAVLELYGEGALLRSVAVDTAARGTGLGRQLTEAALRLAVRRLTSPVSRRTQWGAAVTSRTGLERYGVGRQGRRCQDRHTLRGLSRTLRDALP